MKKTITVIAPHPDDETLGCGGTLLRHLAEGDSVHWLIVTAMQTQNGSAEVRRNSEIKQVAERYGFSSVRNLCYPTAELDTIPLQQIIERVGAVFKEITPEIIYLPYRGDVHTDHRIVFDAAIACAKWFRFPSIRRVLAFQTLSETDFSLNPDSNGFRPNVFIDISDYLETKIDIMKLYASELGKFPFPRSVETARALAVLHGAAAGCRAAEAFMLLREIL